MAGKPLPAWVSKAIKVASEFNDAAHHKYVGAEDWTSVPKVAGFYLVDKTCEISDINIWGR